MNLLLSIAMFLGMFVGVSQAQSADFTGTWVISEGLSEPMDPIFELQGVSWAMRKAAAGLDREASITQSADRMVVTFDNLSGTQNQVLVFDGQPHQTVNPAGHATTLTTAWQGEALVSTGSVDIEGQVATLMERRSLSTDGGTMTVQVTLTTPGGQSAASRRVYNKQ